jgi:hypothetical protein
VRQALQTLIDACLAAQTEALSFEVEDVTKQYLLLYKVCIGYCTADTCYLSYWQTKPVVLYVVQ